MKKLFILATILAAILFVACAPSDDKMLVKIHKMENDMKVITKPDSNAVKVLLGMYQDFAKRFPEDSLAPDFLYKGAGIEVGFNRGSQAVELYEFIKTTYPTYQRMPECVFMEAYTYENILGNTAKAGMLYHEFLAKYPRHELADDAQAAIKYLGKSPEEMIHDFEQNQAAVDSAKK